MSFRSLSFPRRARSFVGVAAFAVLAFGLGAPSQADEGGGLVPGSCKLHPHHVVSPGCDDAVLSHVDGIPGDPGTTYPNLSPDVQGMFVLESFFFDPETETLVLGPPELYFDTRARNLGSVPMQITVEEVESPETSTVSQCISWRAPDAHACERMTTVGGFTWHDEHTHFHFEEFARYELRRLAADGRPDYSDAGLIDASDKVSFCMIDSVRVRDDAAPAPFYQTCLPTVQGISAGWADIYDSSLEGQQLSLEGLEDGRYALVIAVNYSQRLHETDYSDNVLEATVELANGLTEATVVDRRWR